MRQPLRQYVSVVRQYPWFWWPLVLTATGYGYTLQFLRQAWSLELGLAGVGLWIAGTSADVLTTWLAFDLKPAYDRRGLPFPNAEICPLLPPYPTLRDLLTNKSMLISLLAIPAVFLLPGAGLGGGVLHLCAAVFNWRQRQNMKRGLQAFDARQPRVLQGLEGGAWNS